MHDNSRTRKYSRLKGVIDIQCFREMVESGQHTHEVISSKFGINRRQIRYLINKFVIVNNLLIDRSYMQSQGFRDSISIANTGKRRTEEHKQNYRDVASRRDVKNNVGSGWHHTLETIEKITASNDKTYAMLPQKWLDACINNIEWFEKLSESARGKIKSAEHIRKIVESKTGMPYEEWQIVRGEFDLYRAEVRRITESQQLSTLPDHGKRGSTHHLDHMFSVHEGFRQQISAAVIGHITNLTMLPSRDNITKNKKCAISLEELLRRYNEFTAK